MTNTIIPERLPLIDQIQPVRGPAADPGDQTPEQACVMQMAAWLTGEPWTDRPACVDPQLAALLRDVNDSLPEDVLSTWAPQVAPLVVGITDASELLDRLAVRRLREGVLPLAPSWPDKVRHQVVAAVEQVIAAIESGDRDSASAAAESATQAAEAAVRAAQSDNRGARAARSAMWAAQSAYSAVWAAQAAQSSWEAAKGSARTSARLSEQSAWEAAEESARLSEQSAWEAAEESVAQLTAAATWVAEANRILDELRTSTQL